MSDQIRLIAIEPHDGRQPGDTYSATERTARALLARRLVKMAAPVQNKMAPAHANKGNPSPAAGAEQPLSASPVAQASPETTVPSSAIGTSPPRGPGRPRLPRGPDGKPLRSTTPTD